MSDPAQAAVRRAYELGEYDCLQQMEASAREALKPVREMVEWWVTENALPPEAWQILEELKPLVFSTEELP